VSGSPGAAKEIGIIVARQKIDVAARRQRGLAIKEGTI
jgi:hypothetical protein